MGLDVYVGTLTRYYAGEWETIVQQASRAMGMEVMVLRPGAEEDAVRDPLAIEEAVVTWRDRLTAALGEHLRQPLSWSEGLAAPYFTLKPAWDCWGALAIHAAHDEHPDVPLPDTAPDDWRAHPAIARSIESGGDCRYGQLLHDVELWLPSDFDFTFHTHDVGGREVGIGSVPALARQLRDLNARTWQADSATLEGWLREGAEYRGPFERSARFGFAVVMELLESAEQHGLPMKLDY